MKNTLLYFGALLSMMAGCSPAQPSTPGITTTVEASPAGLEVKITDERQICKDGQDIYLLEGEVKNIHGGDRLMAVTVMFPDGTSESEFIAVNEKEVRFGADFEVPVAGSYVFRLIPDRRSGYVSNTGRPYFERTFYLAPGCGQKFPGAPANLKNLA